MKTFLLIIEFVTALILIVAILLHSPKGEGLGAIGGQARMFKAPNGIEAGLNRFTTILAVVFLVTAILLSILF